MNRLASFDAAGTKRRLAILKTLYSRELDLGELCLLLNENKRSKAFYHLKQLKAAGLVASKPALKGNGKKVVRWQLSGEGQQALAYFCGEAFLK